MSVKSRIASVFMILCALALAGCAKNDGALDVGLTKIYIPQATAGQGGRYLVPGGGGDGKFTSLNYEIDIDKLNILLGVMRSGKITNASGFTVDVVVATQETNDALLDESYMVLPSEIYELPDKVTVAPNTDNKPFRLTIDIKKFSNSAYIGKTLVLAVKIANPTAYELSDVNTTVIVVIDVNAMRRVLNLGA